MDFAYNFFKVNIVVNVSEENAMCMTSSTAKNSNVRPITRGF